MYVIITLSLDLVLVIAITTKKGGDVLPGARNSYLTFYFTLNGDRCNQWEPENKLHVNAKK